MARSSWSWQLSLSLSITLLLAAPLTADAQGGITDAIANGAVGTVGLDRGAAQQDVNAILDTVRAQLRAARDAGAEFSALHARVSEQVARLPADKVRLAEQEAELAKLDAATPPVDLAENAQFILKREQLRQWVTAEAGRIAQNEATIKGNVEIVRQRGQQLLALDAKVIEEINAAAKTAEEYCPPEGADQAAALVAAMREIQTALTGLQGLAAPLGAWGTKFDGYLKGDTFPQAGDLVPGLITEREQIYQPFTQQNKDVLVQKPAEGAGGTSVPIKVDTSKLNGQTYVRIQKATDPDSAALGPAGIPVAADGTANLPVPHEAGDGYEIRVYEGGRELVQRVPFKVTEGAPLLMAPDSAAAGGTVAVELTQSLPGTTYVRIQRSSDPPDAAKGPAGIPVRAGKATVPVPTEPGDDYEIRTYKGGTELVDRRPIKVAASQ